AGRPRERGRAGPDRARAPRRGTGRAPRCRPRCPWVESSQPLQARCDGFDLHGAVTVAGQDRDRLEQLCRYLLRPPIAQERLALRPDGTVLVTLKTPWRDGTTHLCFEPVTLLERLAALTPRPRINVVLYHGVLAPRARWRAAAVAYGRAEAPATSNDAALIAGPAGPAAGPSAGRRCVGGDRSRTGASLPAAFGPSRGRCTAAALALGRVAPEGLCGGRARVPELRRPDAPDRHDRRSPGRSAHPHAPPPRGRRA